MDCKTHKQVAGLEYDNCDVDGFALHCDGDTVTIVCRDEPGEVTMPKRTFDRLVMAYTKPQTTE